MSIRYAQTKKAFMHSKVLQHTVRLPLVSPVATERTPSNSGNAPLIVAHNTTCGTVGRFFPLRSEPLNS